MRIATFAITGALIVGAAVPAMAAAKKASWTPTFTTCEALAMNRGVDINERRSTDSGQSPYRQFMVACLAGKVEGRPAVAARVAPTAQIAGKWDSCEQLALQRGTASTNDDPRKAGHHPFGSLSSPVLPERCNGGAAVQTGGPLRGPQLLRRCAKFAPVARSCTIARSDSRKSRSGFTNWGWSCAIPSVGSSAHHVGDETKLSRGVLG
jgi:hypothetical protein